MTNPHTTVAEAYGPEVGRVVRNMALIVSEITGDQITLDAHPVDYAYLALTVSGFRFGSYSRDTRMLHLRTITHDPQGILLCVIQALIADFYWIDPEKIKAKALEHSLSYETPKSSVHEFFGAVAEAWNDN